WTLIQQSFFPLYEKMIAGIKAMYMIKKGQTLQGEKFVHGQIDLINELLSLTA
ncbi:IS6 family transposase, partial [Bacillus cereus]